MAKANKNGILAILNHMVQGIYMAKHVVIYDGTLCIKQTYESGVGHQTIIL